MDMAWTLVEMGRLPEAIAVITEARREAGPELELDVLQARVYLRMGMTGEAGALLEPWSAKNPKLASYHQVLGLVHFDQGHTDLAQVALERALALEPDSFDNNNNLGFLLLATDRPEAALPLLRRALELRPGDARAQGNLAFALAALERDEEALEVFGALHPPAVAFSNMGLACERRGAPDLALGWYERALGLDPGQLQASEAVERLSPSLPTEDRE
jgi:tetratricopeptide (TPR) repeat protein